MPVPQANRVQRTLVKKVEESKEERRVRKMPITERVRDALIVTE